MINIAIKYGKVPVPGALQRLKNEVILRRAFHYSQLNIINAHKRQFISSSRSNIRTKHLFEIIYQTFMQC